MKEPGKAKGIGGPMMCARDCASIVLHIYDPHSTSRISMSIPIFTDKKKKNNQPTKKPQKTKLKHLSKVQQPEWKDPDSNPAGLTPEP